MTIVYHKETRNIVNNHLFYKGTSNVEDTQDWEDSYETAEVSDSYLHSIENDFKTTKIFKYIDGNVVIEDEFNECRTNDRIKALKQQLTDSDYKIIKAYEAQLANGVVTYDFEQVHAERQKMRDEINDLETVLAQHSND